MECFAKVISVVIFSLLVGVKGKGQVNVQGVDNAEQFALFCRIYNVARNPPINHVDSQDPLMIVNEIDTLNASFAEKKRLNETEHVGNDTGAQAKPTTTREAAVAQAILRRITEKAHTILEEIKKLNVTRDFEKIKSEFTQVIFGEKMNESDLDKGTLKEVEDRGAACGNPGAGKKGTHAGKNLVVDFFCLCAQRKDDNDGIDNVCGVYVGSSKGGKKPDNHGWGNQAPMGSISMWASIKKGCGNLMHDHPKSTEEGKEVLGDYMKHLKTGGLYRWDSGKQSERKPGMLGTGVGANSGTESGPVCDGKKGNARSQPTGGVCVYYGPSDWDNNIPWLKQFKTALNAVDALHTQTATIQRNIQKLHMLLHRAEETYETTKVITEIEKPVIPTNLQGATKRLTAYNAAWRHHPYPFLEPSVILLL